MHNGVSSTTTQSTAEGKRQTSASDTLAPSTPYETPRASSEDPRSTLQPLPDHSLPSKPAAGTSTSIPRTSKSNQPFNHGSNVTGSQSARKPCRVQEGDGSGQSPRSSGRKKTSLEELRSSAVAAAADFSASLSSELRKRRTTSSSSSRKGPSTGASPRLKGTLAKAYSSGILQDAEEGRDEQATERRHEDRRMKQQAGARAGGGGGCCRFVGVMLGVPLVVVGLLVLVQLGAALLSRGPGQLTTLRHSLSLHSDTLHPHTPATTLQAMKYDVDVSQQTEQEVYPFVGLDPKVVLATCRQLLNTSEDSFPAADQRRLPTSTAEDIDADGLSSQALGWISTELRKESAQCTEVLKYLERLLACPSTLQYTAHPIPEKNLKEGKEEEEGERWKAEERTLQGVAKLDQEELQAVVEAMREELHQANTRIQQQDELRAELETTQSEMKELSFVVLECEEKRGEVMRELLECQSEEQSAHDDEASSSAGEDSDLLLTFLEETVGGLRAELAQCQAELQSKGGAPHTLQGLQDMAAACPPALLESSGSFSNQEREELQGRVRELEGKLQASQEELVTATNDLQGVSRALETQAEELKDLQETYTAQVEEIEQCSLAAAKQKSGMMWNTMVILVFLVLALVLPFGLSAMKSHLPANLIPQTPSLNFLNQLAGQHFFDSVVPQTSERRASLEITREDEEASPGLGRDGEYVPVGEGAGLAAIKVMGDMEAMLAQLQEKAAYLAKLRAEGRAEGDMTARSTASSILEDLFSPRPPELKEASASMVASRAIKRLSPLKDSKAVVAEKEKKAKAWASVLSEEAEELQASLQERSQVVTKIMKYVNESEQEFEQRQWRNAQ